MDRLAIAEEVMSSAGNILAAAGYTSEEIEAIFRQAADQIASGVAFDPAPSNDVNRHAFDTAAEKILTAFEEVDAVRALAKLRSRADALDRPHNSRKALDRCVPLASKMLPEIASAQTWLLREASAAGVTILPSRKDWIADVSDADLDKEHELIFFDSYELQDRLNLDFLTEVAHALVSLGTTVEFEAFYSALVESRLALSVELRSAMEDGKQAFATKRVFQEEVLAQSDEFAETAFIQEFVARHDVPERPHVLMGWMQQLEEQGRLSRYKRSNRWRVSVAPQ